MELGAEVSLGRGKGGLWVENEGRSGKLVTAVGFAGRRWGKWSMETGWREWWLAVGKRWGRWSL